MIKNKKKKYIKFELLTIVEYKIRVILLKINISIYFINDIVNLFVSKNFLYK